MTKEVDVIFFVEHKDRELESIKNIVEKLKARGISAIVLSMYYHVHKLYSYKAKLYFFPFLINRNDWPASVVYRMYGDSVAYVNMNWEQLISKVNEEYKKPQDDFVKNIVKHIAWSDNFKTYLKKYGVRGDSVRVTGNPANEILFGLSDKKNSWREKLSADFGLDENKKWLFMPMNYGWAFSSDNLINAKIQKGYPEDVAWEYRKYSQKCLKEFIHFISDVADRHDYEIIIRPHPSITEQQYEEVFKREVGGVHDSITLNKAYSIREWIVACEYVGSSWSTSVWDAYNIGKEVFLFTPYERPDWLDVWWNSDVENILPGEKLRFSSNNTETANEINVSENIAGFSAELLKSVEKPKRERVIFDTKTNLKILKCFLLEKGIIKSKSLQYDYFDMVK